MGYKVYLIGICFGIFKDWNFKWYVNKVEFVGYLVVDLKVCEMLCKKLVQVGISKILIECLVKIVCVMIYIVCLGVVIGKCGEDIEKLCKEVSEMMGVLVYINVIEVCKLELDVQFVVELIVQQLECCIMFCCVMKCLVGNVMCLGVLGIKVNVGGCFNGVEIVCLEWYCEGCVLLYILCVDIDYGFVEVKMIYGIIGIKVWIYKGEVFDFFQVGQEKQDDILLCNDCYDCGDCGDCQCLVCEVR